MFVAPLGSGSAGNSYLFESEQTRILVDAGFGPRETARRMEAVGRSFNTLTALVITHEHYDHIRGAESIARKLSIPVHLTAGTLAASRLDPHVVRTVTFPNNSTFRIGDIQIHARRTIHDAADPACFVVEAGDGTRVGVASDLGYADQPVVQHLMHCDGLLFESNHDLDMLRSGTYPWSLKRRIMSRYGHLSNDDSMLAVRSMIGHEMKNLCMIHLSAKNNHESIVRTMAAGVIATTGAHLELNIVPQNRPMGMLEISRKGPRRNVLPPAQLRLF